jgi:hypothetical protein
VILPRDSLFDRKCRVRRRRGRGVISNPQFEAQTALARESVLGDKIVTTASVPAEQRLAFWREVVCQTIAGVEARPLTSRRSYDGRIHSRRVHLQELRRFDLLHVVADPQRVKRTR